MTEQITPPPLATDQPATSLTARLVNVFVAPGEVFTELKHQPVNHANWWLPALLFIIASWLAVALMYSQPAIKQQIADTASHAMQKQFQPLIDSGKMTQAQADQQIARTEELLGTFGMVGGLVSPVFYAAVTPFWGGFLLWLGALIFGQRFGYMKAVEAVGLSMVILAVGAIVKGLLCTAAGNMFLSPGPAFLIKDFDAGNPLHTTLLAVDIFVVWSLMLRAVGLAKLAETSFTKAAAWVLGLWLLLTGGMLALSLGAQKLMQTIQGQ
jgi:hypothetical protein